MAGVFVVCGGCWGGGNICHRKAREFMDRVRVSSRYAARWRISNTKPEMEALQKRMDQFVASADSGGTNARLTLSADDLNALVADSGFSNRVYITLTNDAVAGRFSIPFEQLGMPLFRGRYLNGSGTLKVGTTEGSLSVNLQEVSVNGVKVPDHYMEWIRQQNFAQGVGTNAAARHPETRRTRCGGGPTVNLRSRNAASHACTLISSPLPASGSRCRSIDSGRCFDVSWRCFSAFPAHSSFKLNFSTR